MRFYMNKIILIVALIAVSMLAVTTATGRFAPTATVVGTIDLPRVIDELDEWKAELARVEAAGQAFEAEVTRRTEEAELLRADLEDFVAGTKKHEDAQKELKRATINLKAFMMNAERREVAAKTRAVLRIYEHIRKSAGDLAEREGYGLILVDDSSLAINEQSNDVLGEIASRQVLYTQKSLDVSEALIAYMNQQWQEAR